MTNATDIADFMMASGHPVRYVPTTDIEDWERVLRAKLVLSEALEFVVAMGCLVSIDEGTDPDNPIQGIKSITAVSNAAGNIDLVEAADACADLRYVVIGSENTLGIPGDDVFREVHRSNTTKLVHGQVMLDADRKVMKPPTYQPPDVAGVLRDAGWDGS